MFPFPNELLFSAGAEFQANMEKQRLLSAMQRLHVMPLKKCKRRMCFRSSAPQSSVVSGSFCVYVKRTSVTGDMFVHFGENVQRTRRDMVDASSQAQCPEAVVFVDDASLMQSNILWKFDWMTASVYCSRTRHYVFLASISFPICYCVCSQPRISC